MPARACPRTSGPFATSSTRRSVSATTPASARRRRSTRARRPCHNGLITMARCHRATNAWLIALVIGCGASQGASQGESRPAMSANPQAPLDVEWSMTVADRALRVDYVLTNRGDRQVHVFDCLLVKGEKPGTYRRAPGKAVVMEGDPGTAMIW